MIQRLSVSCGCGWLCGADVTQADITAAVGYSFANKVRPKLDLPNKFPALAAHNAKAEALDSFKNVPLPG